MKRLLLVLISLLFVNFISFGQGISCGGASPFCTGSSYTFPAGVNAPAAPPSGTPGPNYGCLYSQPNCAWYYMQVGTPGNIELYIHGSGNFDVDFCCWGPFTNQSLPCLLGLTAGTPTPSHHAAGPDPGIYPTLNMVDCSYDPSYFEWCYIPNAVAGQYYILLITNYSNTAQNIDFSQSNLGAAGAGTTNCGIMPAPINNNGPFCQGDTIKFTAMTVPNATYFWSGPGGFSSNLQNPIRTNASTAMAGNYTCVIMVGTQISPEDTTVVVVHPKPTVTATSDTICVGDTAVLTASGANTYKWIPSNLTANPLHISPPITTNYTVIGKTTFGCKDSAHVFIQVNPGPVVTSNNATICAGDSAILTASGANSYLWNGTITSNPYIVKPVVTTTYTLVGNSLNCLGFASSTVTVHPRPNISLDSVGICKGKTAIMTVLGGAYNTTYTWSNGSTANPLQISPAGSLIIDVIATDSNNCKDTASAMLNVYPTPVAAFTAVPPTASTDNPIIAFTDLSTNASIWQWNFGDANSPDNLSGLQSPSHTYSTAGPFTVSLVVISDHGCTNSTMGSVVIENPYEFFIPNAFNPTSTHEDNATFKPKGVGIDPSKYILMVFDRWGKVVFETTEMNQGWNGKLNNVGDILPGGVYVYYIRFTKLFGVEKEFTGHISLL